MKEFIEKLIKGISNKKDYFQRLYECEGKTEHDADLNKATQLAFDDCLSVIEQLAEEYNNDVCEWEADDKEIDVYYTKRVQVHILIDGSPAENEHKFCPYCGKRIKVVE